MRSFLSSHRRRRRLLWAGAVLSVAAGLVLLGILYPNTAPKRENSFSNDPAAVAAPEPQQVAPPRGPEMTVALKTAATFIKRAVLRQDPAGSWDLVTPALRQGDSRAVWKTGNIPVVPYPEKDLARVRWRLDFSYRNRLGLGVLLQPKPDSQLGPLAFQLELVSRGSGKQRRWLVDSWAPNGAALVQGSGPRTREPGRAPVGSGGGSLSAAWLLVPLGVIGLALLLPLALGLRSWHRASRATREYKGASGLPELPRSFRAR